MFVWLILGVEVDAPLALLAALRGVEVPAHGPLHCHGVHQLSRHVRADELFGQSLAALAHVELEEGFGEA